MRPFVRNFGKFGATKANWRPRQFYFALTMFAVLAYVAWTLHRTASVEPQREEGAEVAAAGQQQLNAQAVAQLWQRVHRIRQLLEDGAKAPRLEKPGSGAPHPSTDPFPYALHRLATSSLPEAGNSSAEDGTIFVSFASFRDIECGRTLSHLFEQAAFPRRIFVGVVEQREQKQHEPYCVTDDLLLCVSSAKTDDAKQADAFCPLHNVRFRRTSPQEAKGPTFGRYVAGLMYQGETYFMMIDSHNRFVARWDAVLVSIYVDVVRRRQGLSVQAPWKAVLSHYPAAFERGIDLSADTGGRERYMRLMCSGHFLAENGIFRLDSELIRTPRDKQAVRQPFVAAGFLFTNASVLTEVPFDPHLDYLFDGEEILHSARLYTHGWDSYMPTFNALYHFYGRPDAPKVWSVPGNLWWVHQKVSHVRVLLLLNQTMDAHRIRDSDAAAYADGRVRRDMELYGMGKARSLADFWKYAHVRVDSHQQDDARGYCHKLLLSDGQTAE